MVSCLLGCRINMVTQTLTIGLTYACRRAENPNTVAIILLIVCKNINTAEFKSLTIYPELANLKNWCFYTITPNCLIKTRSIPAIRYSDMLVNKMTTTDIYTFASQARGLSMKTRSYSIECVSIV